MINISYSQSSSFWLIFESKNMLETSEATLSNFVLHIVGNKAQEEGTIVSNEVIQPDEEMENILLSYFLKSFSKQTVTSRFGHSTNLTLNKVFTSVQSIFESKETLLAASKDILEHLYEQSTHPHIKSGELCIAYFENIVLDGELTEALGIFKSELKEQFLCIDQQSGKINYQLLEGINIHKLDKGCLVFNSEESEGYRVLMVDSNNYDAQYWKEDFLGLVPESMESIQTKYAMEMVQQFADEVLSQPENKKEQLSMLNKSVQFFQKEESFDADNFAEKVLQTPEYIEAFNEYRPKFEEERGIETIQSFEIEEAVVQKNKKKMNSLIRLDNNIQIRLDFDNPEIADKYIEKGYDEVKGMHYYVVYYNNEL